MEFLFPGLLFLFIGLPLLLLALGLCAARLAHRLAAHERSSARTDLSRQLRDEPAADEQEVAWPPAPARD